MRQLLSIFLVLAMGVVASAEEYEGLSLSTPYPAQVVQANEPIVLSLTVRSYGLPPQVVYLEVVEAPEGWKVSFLGGGRVVKAVFVQPDGSANVSLRLEPPEDAQPKTYRFLVAAKGENDRAELPIELTVGEAPPPQLEFEVELPILKGAPNTTFRYRATLKNEGDRDLLVNLEADAPEGFRVTFKLAFGGQEVTSLPIKAGESKRLDIEVRPPREIPMDEYPISVRARAEGVSAQLGLTASVTGQPTLSVTTPEGRLSARVYSGRVTPLQVLIVNRGTAPAKDVKLTAYEPSGWEVSFEPEEIEEIPPDGEAKVTARIKPSPKALAGDYMLTIRASGEGTSDSAEFRITVLTSTMWGLVGIALIALALGVVVFAVARFGRR